MIARALSALRIGALWYLRSWVFLLWSVGCFCAGAALMYYSVIQALPPLVRDMML